MNDFFVWTPLFPYQSLKVDLTPEQLAQLEQVGERLACLPIQPRPVLWTAPTVQRSKS